MKTTTAQSCAQSLIVMLVALGCVAVVDLAAQERTPAYDFDTLNAAGNTVAMGIWSDGTTMWVADWLDEKLYAYTVATKVRDPSKDFDTLSAAGNTDPQGIWSDGTTMWVANEKLYAYTVATKARDPSKDFDTLSAAGNIFPAGIWSDGTTMWVADWWDEKLYAYTVATKARDPSKDFDTLSAAGNISPQGIWSDGATMWVADTTFAEAGDPAAGSWAKLYAYAMPGKDGAPTFGSAVVPPLTYTVGVRISPRVLPAATGGRGRLTYTLAPALPAGLTFTAASRTLAGTPAAVQAETIYALTATDANGDSATLTFRLTVRSGGGSGPWVFTDPTLTAGETPIKAVHFTELREAVNAWQSQCGVARTAWTDPVLTPGVTPVKAVHLTELRTGLTAAYRACGLPAPSFADVVRAGIPIEALHITELRVAVNGASRTVERSDRDILAALYGSAGGENWTRGDNWLTDAALGEWYGVEVNDSGRVVSLDLSSNGLTGTIPPELGNLASLNSLDFADNGFLRDGLSGSIPPELGNLANLTYLNLEFNDLTGGIPSELGRLASLNGLVLVGNDLSGSIPANLGSLGSLTSLWLGHNDLSGAIPAELSALVNLRVLSVTGNRLTGPLPPELGNLVNLGNLYLARNRLTGTVPDSFLGLSRLAYFDFHDNSGLCMPRTPAFLSWRAGIRGRVDGPFCGESSRAPLRDAPGLASGGAVQRSVLREEAKARADEAKDRADAEHRR